MVGDTKFTPDVADGRVGQKDFIGGLKVVILHPGVAIAFAHDVGRAKQAIEGFHSSGVALFDKNAVLDYFLYHHQRSLQPSDDTMVEFIAAFELDDLVSELFLIKHGKIASVDAGYIGSTAAYNSFLHHEQKLKNSESTSFPLVAATQALDAVIRDPDPALQIVDGFTVGLRHSANDGFVYAQRVTVEGRPTPVRSGPMTPVNFGGAPAGANEWSIGSSPGDRFGVLTAYCHTGTFGVIYRPALNFEPRIVRNCTAEDLVGESLLEVNQIKALIAMLET